MGQREIEIQRRIALLIKGFEHYLRAFDEDPAFTKSGQLESHLATIAMRRQLGSAAAASRDIRFLRLLYGTLNVWGIGQRGSKLVNFDQFVRAVGDWELAIGGLEGETLDNAELAVEEVVDRVWNVIDSLRIVENEAKLVPCTKALHHMLPDLVVPMDRLFTRTFFGWHVPEFQYSQEKIFNHAYRHFVRIARETEPARFVAGGWRTSLTKVLDNALVGFCRLERLPLPS